MNQNLLEMPWWQHLDELRQRLWRVVLILAVGLTVTYHYAEDILRFLEQPLLQHLPPEAQHLYFTGITDKFFTYFRVSTYAAIALTAPLWLYQVWKFVAPALHAKEKKGIVGFLALGTLGFYAGLSFGYYLVLPEAYGFLINFGGKNELPLITLSEYFSLTSQLMLLCGVIFELPVALTFLAKIGIVTAPFLRHYRGHAFVILAVISAVLTPTPDAFTMCLVFVPLYGLYEVSILMVAWTTRAERQVTQSA